MTAKQFAALLICAAIIVILGVCSALPAGAETGFASWYSAGHTRADGKRFNANDPTVCAHKSLKLGTRVKVTHLRSGRSIRCTVSDRGPFIRGRIIDLSRAGAKKLGMLRSGTARVSVTVTH